ncbi:MAG: ATP-binding cassette domain-containing protein [Candidatus Krumholzibacteriota bacterium]|nr:ATP-binding cassette domain-containing protein [Candidatus Krumholzibacteriota bacterium]
MIQIKNLSKYYGTTRAVYDLSLEVEKGEVLGFLGPNGAGKTTTMKMLTCYLPPSSGTATIFGFDILNDPMEVRKRIGYLPEKTPLYQEMRVDEYLRFVASVKGMAPPRVKPALGRVIEQCGLEEVHRRSIGKLSKGYQQRVGIAQAIISDPELLILDEPTLGLDPRQIIDIRTMIKNLGRDRTVILSSHILPEVSQVCDRIIIMNQGELVAVDTPDKLRARLKQVSVTRITLRRSDRSRGAREALLEMEGVLMVKEKSSPAQADTLVLQVESRPDRDLREGIAGKLVKEGFPLLEIFHEELSLEDIFIKLVTEEVNR